MISRTELDLRQMDHAARVAWINHHGWMTATPPSADTTRRRIATVAGMTRQWVGVALVGIGARLQGTSARHAGDAAAAV